MITSINEFLQQTKTPKEIVEYITNITPEESDVPDYFLDLVMKSNKIFMLKTLSINDILNNDESAKEYVYSGEERYGEDSDSDYQPHSDDLDNPIVILDNVVLDGYFRITTHFNNNQKTISAYIA